MTARPRARGFTLIELLVTLTVLGILLVSAAPAFSTWVRNARVRTVAQALQDTLRAAQTDALRRNRAVVFTLSNSGPGANPSASANGPNWAAYTVPLLGFEGRVYVGGGSVSEAGGGVTVTGQAAICFNSAGRLSANAAPGVTGATCTITAATPLATYDLSAVGATASDRPLRVTVSLGGQVRLCDPARALSASLADGCP